MKEKTLTGKLNKGVARRILTEVWKWGALFVVLVYLCNLRSGSLSWRLNKIDRRQSHIDQINSIAIKGIKQGLKNSSSAKQNLSQNLRKLIVVFFVMNPSASKIGEK